MPASATTNTEIKADDTFPNAVGNKTPRTTEYTFNLGSQYRPPLFDEVFGFLRVDFERRGDRYWQLGQRRYSRAAQPPERSRRRGNGHMGVLRMGPEHTRRRVLRRLYTYGIQRPGGFRLPGATGRLRSGSQIALLAHRAIKLDDFSCRPSFETRACRPAPQDEGVLVSACSLHPEERREASRLEGWTKGS